MSFDDMEDWKGNVVQSHNKTIAMEFATYLLEVNAEGFPWDGQREKLSELYDEYLLQRKQL